MLRHATASDRSYNMPADLDLIRQISEQPECRSDFRIGVDLIVAKIIAP